MTPKVHRSYRKIRFGRSIADIMRFINQVLEKSDSLTENFQNFATNGFTGTWIHISPYRPYACQVSRKSGRVHLCWVAGNTVIPVALWWDSSHEQLYAPLTFQTFKSVSGSDQTGAYSFITKKGWYFAPFSVASAWSDLAENFMGSLFPHSPSSAKFCPNTSSFRGDIRKCLPDSLQYHREACRFLADVNKMLHKSSLASSGTIYVVFWALFTPTNY